MVTNKVSSGLPKGSCQAAIQSKNNVYYLGELGALLMPNGARVNGGIALPKHALAPPVISSFRSETIQNRRGACDLERLWWPLRGSRKGGSGSSRRIRRALGS